MHSLGELTRMFVFFFYISQYVWLRGSKLVLLLFALLLFCSLPFALAWGTWLERMGEPAGRNWGNPRRPPPVTAL